jgi:hypothetical protein
MTTASTQYNYSIGGGTASTTDFDATQTFSNLVSLTAGKLTVPAGVISFTVTVPTTGDTVDEPNETVPLTISNLANTASATGIGTILDNDPPAISINDVTVDESAGVATFTISLSSAATANVTVSYRTNNAGTAIAPGDFTAVGNTTVTFLPGEISKTISVTIVNDTSVEPSESFNVTLSNQSANATLADATGVGTIVDNDVLLTSLVGSTLTGTGLAGEYYGYNDNRTGVAADDTNKFTVTGVTRIHSDDGNVATATVLQPTADTNLSNLAEVEKVVEGRSADTTLIGSARLAPVNAADAAFTIKTLEFGTAAALNNDLGQSDVKFTNGQTVTSGAAGSVNNLVRFLQSNTTAIIATGGVGDTTDAAIRAVGYVYIPLAGNYDLRILGDDGYRVLVNGVNLTEFDGIQPPSTAVFTNKALAAGIQPIEILYWDQAGQAQLRIEVKPSGAADAAYEVLGTKSFALFAPGSQPTGLTSSQDLVETSDGVWAVRTGSTHTSDAGSQQVIGSAGNDSISTGADNDVLTGGAGNDRLTGGSGSDTFVWRLADQGTASHPARDVISDFNTATPAAGGDVLDLRDLLQGENHPTGIGNLGSYLHFAQSGADTILEVKHTGSGSVTQQIVFEGVDLTSNGTSTDAQIIQSLLTNGKLIVDL